MNTRNFLRICSFALFCVILSNVYAQDTRINPGESAQNIIPMRERVKIMQRWWDWKKENVLPVVMREQGVDMWIIRNNEAELYYNNEGPVYTSLVPANFEGMTFSSVHGAGSQFTPGFMMYYDRGGEIEYVEPRDYKHITQLVRERDHRTIAIGQFDNEDMLTALGSNYSSQAVDSWTLGVRWLETVGPEQIRMYRYVQEVANDIIAEGFSNKAVVPEVTTTDDLNWWFRHKMLDLNIEYENHPSVTVQRRSAHIAKYGDPPEYFRKGKTRNGVNVVIRRGDVISLDSDMFLLGIVTDSHQHAYVLGDEELDVPDGMKKALRSVNKMNDLYREVFNVGRTGIEITQASQKIPFEEGVIEGGMNIHPPPTYISRFLQGGYMFSHKTYVAGLSSASGYYPTSIVSNNHKLFYNTVTVYHPHFQATAPGWEEHGFDLTVGQLAVFTEDGLKYLERPMTAWHVIK